MLQPRRRALRNSCYELCRVVLFEGCQEVRRTEDDYRIIAKDGRCFPSTADLKKDRVNFWIFHGKVIKASTF
jgi:hypothetical protein